MRQIDQGRHLERQRASFLGLFQTFLKIWQRRVIPLAVIKHDSVAQVDHRGKHMIVRTFDLLSRKKQIIGPIRLVSRLVVLTDHRTKIVRLRLPVTVAVLHKIINPDIHHPLINPRLVGVVLSERPQQTIRGIEIAAGGLRIGSGIQNDQRTVRPGVQKTLSPTQILRESGSTAARRGHKSTDNEDYRRKLSHHNFHRHLVIRWLVQSAFA